MFRDLVGDIVVAGSKSITLTQRQVVDLFYAGLVTGAKYCGQATDEPQLNNLVNDIFNEVESFTYGKYRTQAKEMIEKFGIENARQRLRAIALDKLWRVDEASTCFGVDLAKFDSIDELVNFTRALRNRGVGFEVELHDKGKSPDGPNRVKTELVTSEPVNAAALSGLFGGAPVQDCRAPTQDVPGSPGRYDARYTSLNDLAEPAPDSRYDQQSYKLPSNPACKIPNDLAEQTNTADPREAELASDTRFATRDGQSYTRAELVNRLHNLLGKFQN